MRALWRLDDQNFDFSQPNLKSCVLYGLGNGQGCVEWGVDNSQAGQWCEIHR